MTPRGLLSIRYRCEDGGFTGRPSTVTRSRSGSISKPVAGGLSPLMRTEPDAIRSSAARRLATPARARKRFSRSLVERSRRLSAWEGDRATRDPSPGGTSSSFRRALAGPVQRLPQLLERAFDRVAVGVGRLLQLAHLQSSVGAEKNRLERGRHIAGPHELRGCAVSSRGPLSQATGSLVSTWMGPKRSFCRTR